jgi:TatD DNase family protein
MMIDTHAHMDFSDYDNDRDTIIKKCTKAGISLINPGTDIKTSEAAVALAGKYENIFAAVGLHPENIKYPFLDKADSGLEKDFDFIRYRELAKSKKVVAIGEIGLDFWNQPKSKEKRKIFQEEQEKVFTAQIDLAEELDLPLIVHCRNSFDKTGEILEKRKTRGVIHCFTGNIEQAKRFLDLGYYLGINGIIFKLDLVEVIKNCPMDKILLETDCPFLSPTGFKKRNSPLSLPIIIAEISRIKNISTKEVVQATEINAKNLFKI